MAIRWEHRVEDVLDTRVRDDQCEALEQSLTSGLERRQSQRLREFEVGVRQQRERQVQPLGRLALIVGVLSRQAEYERRTRGAQVLEVVAESARLRCAPARP